MTKPVGADSLTKREKEVLEQIADGFTNHEIGHNLNISHHTVGVHRNRLLKKVGVNHTIALILWAIDEGIL